MKNLESVYDEKIAPLMEQVIAIAKEHKLPMFATFQYADDPEEGASFCTTALPFEGCSPKIDEMRRALMRGPSFVSMTITSEPKKDPP